jgi:hypothetical protein
MDAAVHHFLASLPPPALDPKLLSHATENHLRIFQGRLIRAAALSGWHTSENSSFAFGACLVRRCLPRGG